MGWTRIRKSLNKAITEVQVRDRYLSAKSFEGFDFSSLKLKHLALFLMTPSGGNDWFVGFK